MASDQKVEIIPVPSPDTEVVDELMEKHLLPPIKRFAASPTFATALIEKTIELIKLAAAVEGLDGPAKKARVLEGLSEIFGSEVVEIGEVIVEVVILISKSQGTMSALAKLRTATVCCACQ